MDRFILNRRLRRGQVVGTSVLLAAATILAALTVVAAGSAASAAACSFCGKNLVLNPGAESGKGLTATGTNGAVPHWTSTEGPVRRGRLYRLRCRLVLGELEGPCGQGQELLLRWHDDSCDLGEGEHRQPDDQAPRERCRTQGDAQRLARELRLEYRQRSRDVHRRVGEDACGNQDRAGLDARRRRHGASLAHGHRSGGSDRRDRDDHVHRPRELQPGGRRRHLAGAYLSYQAGRRAGQSEPARASASPSSITRPAARSASSSGPSSAVRSRASVRS